jgi:adenosylcobinamide kinase/adenosylcobinamide-phosphate guanylyltransferase
VLVTGGARSGKSVHAEGLLAAAPAVTYVATAPTRYDDPDWQDRVALHRVRRPAHWRTVEDADLAEVLAGLSPDDPPVLVDCLTLWLTAAMDDAGCWDERPGSAAALAAATDRLVEAWRGTRGHVVAVTNEVGDGVVPATASGRAFRDALGVLNLRVAAAADEVWHVVVGIPARLR